MNWAFICKILRRHLGMAIMGWAVAASPGWAAPNVRRDETVQAVQKVMPSVVNISGKTVMVRRGFLFDWWEKNWSPFYRELPPQFSAGSGVIIDEEGYVLSNVHVIEEASEIVVTLADNRSYPAELVVGTRKSDVALLKIRAQPGEKFTPIEFAADDDLLLGETVIALGNPFGLGGSVSRGILSSKTRRKSAQEGVLEMEDWIQTDAAINPGNSGGPLVNLEGKLIGLNVAVYREGQGIGFAIPVQRVAEALSEIYTPETMRGLWFGAKFRASTNGVSVDSVEAGSPAEVGGFRKGDLVVKVNSAAPRGLFAFQREILRMTEQQEVSFQLRRGGTTRQATVRMVPEASHFNGSLIRRKIGLGVRMLSTQDAARLSLPVPAALLITEVDSGGPAEQAGLQPGMVLEAVDQAPARSIIATARALAARTRGEAARLTVLVPGLGRRAEIAVRVR